MSGPFEIILPRRVLPQPVPGLSAGGDCGACVLAGLLGIADLGEIYARFGRGHRKAEDDRGGHVDAFDWYAMRDACWTANGAAGEHLLARLVPDVPLYVESWMAGAMALSCALDHQAWWRRMVMAMEAGYYGLAMVDTERRGASGKGPNHWVMLVGIRDLDAQEVLVSCSSSRTPDEEWVQMNDFLERRGGYNAILARPAKHAAVLGSK